MPASPPPEPSGELFHRPGWMVKGNAVAAGIGLVAATLSWFTGKGFFAILWVIVALFWLRRYIWVREAPLFELVPGALIAHLSAVRQHRLEMDEVERIEVEEERLLVHTKDGAHTVFKSSDLRQGEWSRFVETLQSVRARAGNSEARETPGG